MDYDFITTCNWTATGTYTLQAHRGSNTNVVTTHYASIHYRKKGTATWSTLNSSGQINITSTGEWEIGNDWNKSGNDCLTHSYYEITAIDECTDVYFDETALGTNCGNFFLYRCWSSCSNLKSMPSDFNIPTVITTVGDYFLVGTWQSCYVLTLMPDGFNIPTGITGTVGKSFMSQTWAYCNSLIRMPSNFNIPTGITTSSYYFFQRTWEGCSSLSSMPMNFQIPTSLTYTSSYPFYETWYDCTLLTSNGYTENITFRFSCSSTFGGTCPITTDSPGGTSAIPVNVAVRRYKFPYIRINIGDSWKTVTDVQINVGDSWKTVDMYSSEINIGDTWKSLST